MGGESVLEGREGWLVRLAAEEEPAAGAVLASGLDWLAVRLVVSSPPPAARPRPSAGGFAGGFGRAVGRRWGGRERTPALRGPAGRRRVSSGPAVGGLSGRGAWRTGWTGLPLVVWAEEGSTRPVSE